MVAGIVRFTDALANCPDAEATIVQWVGTKGHDGVALAIVKPGAKLKVSAERAKIKSRCALPA